MHSVLPPNYKRHREIVAFHFHDLGLEHEIESFLSVMASYRMEKTPHFGLVLSSISSKSAQYFT